MRAITLLLATALPLCAQAPTKLPTEAPAQAETPGTHPRSGHGRMAERLGLSPEQQAKLKAIHESHRTAMKANHETTRAQAKAFRAAMEDPKASETQLRQAFDQLNAQRFQSLLAKRAMRQEMRVVLTPDQLQKWDAQRALFQEQMKTRMEQRHKGWMENQPDPENS